MSVFPCRRAILALACVLPLSACNFGLPQGAPVSTVTVAVPAATPDTAPTTGDTGTPTGSDRAPSSSSTPTPSTTTSGQPSPSTTDQVAKLEGGNGSAMPFVVPTSALPSGWTASPPRDTRGYRMTVCGVDLEPAKPVDGVQQDWESSTEGLHLEQHVRVYADDTAAKVTSDLAKALPGCTSYTAKDGQGGQSTFTVEKPALKGVPAGVIVWRQKVDYPIPGSAPSSSGTATASATPRTVQVTQDVAVRRIGKAVVLLDSYGVGKAPDDAALLSAVKAVG